MLLLKHNLKKIKKEGEIIFRCFFGQLFFVLLYRNDIDKEIKMKYDVIKCELPS